MQINSININNNSTSFKGVIYHNKQNFIKAGFCQVHELLASEIVSSFKNKNDYDLLLNVNSQGELSYKIKSIGQGLKGFCKNIIAPWLPFNIKRLTPEIAEKYIAKWHKK